MWEIEHVPHWLIDQARIVRHAEFKGQEAQEERQAKRAKKRGKR